MIPVAALLIALQAPAPTADFRTARARLDSLNAREAELARRVGGNRETQARLLSALQAARRDPPPALLVSPQSAKDAVRAAILMRALEPELERRARALAAESAELGKVRRQAAEASADLFAAESSAADRSATGGGPNRRATTAPVIALSPTPLAPLRAPAAGEVVRRYGDPWPGLGRSEGWSWRTAPDAPVVSPADGRVEYVGPLKNWGLVVVLQRPDGWRAVVAGMQSADLAPGQTVRSGQAIGSMPPRRGAAPEVYLELRRGSDPVDPGPYILRPAF